LSRRLLKITGENLAIAFTITLLAHVWCGWVWGWILREFNQPAGSIWSIQTYLTTNIAKYLPGNVWHFYGRVWAAKTAGVAFSAATLSVLIEPLLMAAAAIVMALAGNLSLHWGVTLSLAIVLIGVHPRFLNPLLRMLQRSKQKAQGTVQVTVREAAVQDATVPNTTADEPMSIQLRRYPLLPFLGELVFLGLRSAGFLITLLALTPVDVAKMPLVISTFSLAWLLGLVVPGAPGGLGVFEATAIALLNPHFASGIILSLVALYRLISILAEASGAGLSWLSQRWNHSV
jgi:glycosyltransferase 2 family protein